MGTYDTSIRVLACPGCGAPVDVALDGGKVQCGYCGVAAVYSTRPGAPAVVQSMVPESERLERLRAQVGREEPIPDDMKPFLSGPMDAQRREQAEVMLRSARAQAGSDTRDGTVHWLTVALYNAYAGPENARRQRALLETATETLATSSRRQVLLGMLARNAARTGELAAAEHWLSQMDPQSTLLPAFSAHRLTRAYVDTVRADYPGVLDALGEELIDVPLSGGDTLMASVLRANAHERLGDAPTGAAQIAAYMKKAPPFRPLIERIIAANPTLALCPEAIVLARTVLDRQRE
ncbi:MAG: hypothetical protein AAF799_39080 [Myxococcota bacterium]